jgi:hypothetical protein
MGAAAPCPMRTGLIEQGPRFAVWEGGQPVCRTAHDLGHTHIMPYRFALSAAWENGIGGK